MFPASFPELKQYTATEPDEIILYAAQNTDYTVLPPSSKDAKNTVFHHCKTFNNKLFLNFNPFWKFPAKCYIICFEMDNNSVSVKACIVHRLG